MNLYTVSLCTMYTYLFCTCAILMSGLFVLFVCYVLFVAAVGNTDNCSNFVGGISTDLMHNFCVFLLFIPSYRRLIYNYIYFFL